MKTKTKLKLRRKASSFKLDLKIKTKGINYILISLAFWVSVQYLDINEMAAQPEKTVPTVAQSETAVEISDTGCNGAGYEICDSAEEGTMPES